MPHTAIEVANTLVEEARARNMALTPMQLLKLVYFAHGWHLALTGEPLINEVVQAWQFGPVVPSVYHNFKQYKADKITELATSINFGDGCKSWTFTTPIISVGDNIREFLKKILDVYGNMNGVQLSNLTHQTDSPWFKIWNASGQFIKGTSIPNEEIKGYFCQKLIQNQAKPAG